MLANSVNQGTKFSEQATNNMFLLKFIDYSRVNNTCLFLVELNRLIGLNLVYIKTKAKRFSFQINT